MMTIRVVVSIGIPPSISLVLPRLCLSGEEARVARGCTGVNVIGNSRKQFEDRTSPSRQGVGTTTHAAHLREKWWSRLPPSRAERRLGAMRTAEVRHGL